MTRAEFKTKVLRMARKWPDARFVLQASEETDFLAEMAQWLRDASRATKCLYRTHCALTLVADTRDYKLTGTAFERPMFGLDMVVIDGRRLNNMVGIPKEQDPAQLASANPEWFDDESGKPSGFIIENSDTLRLFPAPDDTFDGRNYVVGYGLHYTMASDSDELEIPENMIQDVADFCAMRWLSQANPFEMYGTEWERVQAQFAKVRSRSEAQHSLASPRGQKGREFLNFDRRSGRL